MHIFYCALSRYAQLDKKILCFTAYFGILELHMDQQLQDEYFQKVEPLPRIWGRIAIVFVFLHYSL